MKTEKDWIEKVGAPAYSAIREMVLAAQCDYDRLEELRDEAEAHDGGREAWAKENEAEAEELAELEKEAGCCERREEAEQRIIEDPLSVQFRSGWVSSKEEMEPEEFNILLTTGGPAVRIVGEIRDGQPHRPRLEVQDWGKPWTEYFSAESEILEIYCTYFYFGE
jgi:hypothetical protein